ncbi:MAG: hypothetical protein AAGG59_08475 [Bacteroidota bacterium]
MAKIFVKRKLFTQPFHTSASFSNRSKILIGLVFLEISYSLRFRVFHAFFDTTNGYYPFTPFLYAAANLCPSSSKVTGLRMPDFSRLIGN